MPWPQELLVWNPDTSLEVSRLPLQGKMWARENPAPQPPQDQLAGFQLHPLQPWEEGLQTCCFQSPIHMIMVLKTYMSIVILNKWTLKQTVYLHCMHAQCIRHQPWSCLSRRSSSFKVTMLWVLKIFPTFPRSSLFRVVSHSLPSSCRFLVQV